MHNLSRAKANKAQLGNVKDQANNHSMNIQKLTFYSYTQ